MKEFLEAYPLKIEIPEDAIDAFALVMNEAKDDPAPVHPLPQFSV